MALAGVLATFVASAAAPPRCPDGSAPSLTGDAFAPVGCEGSRSLTLAGHDPLGPPWALPGAPAELTGKFRLKELAGRWAGSLVNGLGRYELLLEIAQRRGGTIEFALRLKELQFRERLAHGLTLSPAKGPGVYVALLRSDAAPEARLAGSARLGLAPAEGAADESASPAPDRDGQADLRFDNGASHRLRWHLEGKDELRLRLWSALPGAPPPQPIGATLRRTKRESL